MNAEVPRAQMVRPSLRWLDPVGGMVSAGCALHCLATPLLLLMAPVLVGEELELGLALVAVAVAAIVGLRDWRRRRGRLVPLLVIVGVAAMTTRFAMGESPAELVLSLVGAASFVAAHVASFRALRRECCDTCPPPASAPRA